MSLVRRAGAAIDRLLPPACAVCRATVPPGPPLCGICDGRLPGVPRPRCGRCGAPDTSGVDVPGCPACDPWPVELLRGASAVLHAPPADELVAGFKYRGWTALAPALARHMAEPARRLAASGGVRPGPGPVLLPVPLDPRRARRRGYNQAELLARSLGLATGWTIGPAGLRRRPRRRRQAELGRVERLENVRSAVAWDRTVPAPTRPVLLVDDVLTTGATAGACAAALAAVGAECLGVVTFARSIPRPDEG